MVFFCKGRLDDDCNFGVIDDKIGEYKLSVHAAKAGK
jgi:hypothetical protein